MIAKEAVKKLVNETQMQRPSVSLQPLAAKPRHCEEAAGSQKQYSRLFYGSQSLLLQELWNAGSPYSKEAAQ